MLRINLLPAYVTQRRLNRRLTILFALLLIVCVAAPLAVYVSLKTKLAKITDDANKAVAGKAITDQLKTQATTTASSVDPLVAKIAFVKAVHEYGTSWVKLYNTLADTSPKSSFIYTDASVSGSTMTIKAYSPSVEEVGRYLQAMYREPDFQTVAVDKVPGYPDNVRHLYYLNGVLVFADGASGSSSSSSSGYQGSSSSGYPSSSSSGYSSGSQSTGGGSGPANYNPDALGPNGPSNIPPGVGPPPPELTGGAPSGGPTSGGQASSSGSQSSGGYSDKFLAIAGKDISPFALPEVRDQILKQALRRVVVKTVPKGFDITVTAVLNDDIQKSLTAPTLPGSAPAVGTGSRPAFGGPPPGSQGRASG